MADVDFSDIESTTAWFELQSPEMRCTMTSRAALRVMANIGSADDIHNEPLALAVQRAILTSAVRGVEHTAKVQRELGHSSHGAALFINTVEDDALAVDSEVHGAALTADSVPVLSAAKAAVLAVNSARNAAHAVAHAADDFHGAIVRAASLAATQTDSTFKAERLMQTAVWIGCPVPDAVFLNHGVFMQSLYCHPDWAFWADWYRGMWDGTFRDWDLATEVALIPDEIWEGEDALAKVAEAIREIEAKRALSSQIKAFREAQAHTSADAFRPARGHNNPPELIDEPQLVKRVEIVWSALDTLAQEAEAETPDKGKALQALVIVRDWFFTACIYVGRKADLMIDTTIKWGIPVLGGGYLATHPDKLQKIIELAEIWLKP